MPLAITAVTGDPTLTFAATDASGDALVAQIFAGVCVVARVRSEETLLQRLGGGGPGSTVSFGFYVPGAGPLRPSHRLEAWAEVSLGTVQVVGGQHAGSGPYGVDRPTVELVDDGRGSGSQWPYLRFTAHGGRAMTVRYRLTVTSPAE